MTRSRIDSLIQMQEGLPEVTRQSLDKLQLEKLNRVLKREKERGGFYRDLPERLSSLEELSVLPFTTEEDLAQNAAGLLLCSQGEIQRVLSDATSGTTGAAKRVFYTEGDCRHTVELFMEDENEEMTVRFVTTLRQNALEGLISKESPLGQAVLGHGAGERVFVRVSGDAGYWVQIRSISKGEDDDSLDISSY